MSEVSTPAARPAVTELDADGAQTQLQELLQAIRTAVLATAPASGDPEASYTPCVWDDDGKLYVYVSALARHTSHLRRGSPIGVLLIEDESAAASLHARRRVSWSCGVSAVERDSETFASVMRRFHERFGGIMETLESMQDFQLFALEPGEGRLVLGFGAAFRVVGLEVQRQLQGRHKPAGER